MTENKSGINFDYPQEVDDNLIPKSIDISYTNDIDIIKIHNAIRDIFASKRSLIETYRKKIEFLESTDSTMSINQLRAITEEIESTNIQINELETGTHWNDYVARVKKYLLYYESVDVKNDKKQINQRLKIIHKYIAIANNYITLNITKIEQTNAACPLCGTFIKNFNSDEDANICECPTCGWFRENLSKSAHSQNLLAHNVVKNDYENRENFYKAVLRFACKQTKVFHPKLEEDLDEYFTSINMGTCSDIRNRPTVDGRKEGINFNTLLKALTLLSKTKNPRYAYRKVYKNYYEDIWLLLHVHCGFSVNNIDHLIPRLMKMYDSTQEIYNSMSQTERGGRDASLNTQYRLLVQLLACDYPCDKNDFKLPKCRTSLELHQKNWKKMCFETGTHFYEII